MLRKSRAKSSKTTQIEITNSMDRILCLCSTVCILQNSKRASNHFLEYAECRYRAHLVPLRPLPTLPYLAAPSPSPSPILRYIFLPFVTPIWRNSMGGLEPTCSLGRSARSWTRHRHSEPSLRCCRIIFLRMKETFLIFEITSKNVRECSKVFP